MLHRAVARCQPSFDRAAGTRYSPGMENYPFVTGTFPSPAEGLRAVTTLNNGARMPWLGLGVFQVPADADAERMVRTAIDLGYRHIDTAALYHNERGVGRAVRECGVERGEIFVTTKVWNDDIRAGRIREACDASLQRLGLDYVDLYLLHWPIRGRHREAWAAMEALHAAGRARAIGVSNYLVSHLEELLPGATITPAVNQIEFHPYLQSRPLLHFCRERDIRITAWSPLMQAGPLLQDPVLAAIARRHGKTVAQVILRWDLQLGVVTIPKSVRPERMAENAAVFDFALDDAELEAIAALDADRRNGPDPLNFNF
jgi:methylglyoxal/glyoxal reductase